MNALKWVHNRMMKAAALEVAAQKLHSAKNAVPTWAFNKNRNCQSMKCVPHARMRRTKQISGLPTRLDMESQNGTSLLRKIPGVPGLIEGSSKLPRR